MSVTRSASLLTIALVLIAGCGKFLGLDDEEPSGSATTDGGTDGETFADGSNVVDGSGSTSDAPPEAAVVVDAGPCGHCASKHCESDGGCHPLVFVTSGAVKGSFGKGLLAAYEAGRAICNSSFDGGAKFDPWISHATGGPAVYITSTRPYRLVDGTMVASDAQSLKSGTLQSAINRTETGELLDGGYVWTGTTVTGAKSGLDCALWTKNIDDGSLGNVGLVGSTTSGWTYDTDLDCFQKAHLYCFEQQP